MLVSQRKRFLPVIILLVASVAMMVGCDRSSPPAVAPSAPPEPKQAESAPPPAPSAAAPPASVAPKPKLTRQQRIAAALDDQAAGKFDAAAKAFQAILIGDPDDVEVLFHLANTVAGGGDRNKAIELLSQIPWDHPEAGIPALGVSAGLCIEVKRYRDAEIRYRKILELNSGVDFARRQLAYLLNRQGRRHEANVLIRELCLAGNVMQDELHALISESDAMYDSPGTQPVGDTRPYWPIGPGGEGRYLFTERKYDAAVQVLLPWVESGDASDSDIALLGRCATEAQDDAALATWQTHVNESVQEFPEYWASVGVKLMAEAKFDDAVAALAEAIRLDPTDSRSVRRLFQGLRSQERTDEAEIWIDRYALMDKIVRLSNDIAALSVPPPTSFALLSENLETVGRRLEAVLWRVVAASRTGASQDSMAKLGQAMKSVKESGASFGSRDEVWCGMKLDEHPLPSMEAIVQNSSDQDDSSTGEDRQVTPPAITVAPSFRDVSAQVGLQHAYRLATEPIEKAFAIYQSIGGGSAVIDFDRDGWPDLYLAQGAADPDTFVADESDHLYRSSGGSEGQAELKLVSQAAGINDADYSVGVTSGDWNQDGFPDLAVSNIGVNRLMINQGDGTFVTVNLDDDPDFTMLSTSMAIADVTGDGLPDLVSLNYIRDQDIAKHPETDANGNAVDAIPPLSFRPAKNCLYVNDAEGTFTRSYLEGDQSQGCTSLGLVIADLISDKPGNEIFVSNDVRNNELWVHDADGALVDLAVPYGVAYGSLGSATAAMGIASADFDRTGSLDLHVTNFIKEPVSLYIAGKTLFRDLHYRFKLAESSIPMLGFGTQAIDYANDGWRDLIVTNGHVEDVEDRGQPFRQPMQLLANTGGQFEAVTSAFLSLPRLGRSLSLLDFDRNGQLDFVVTDMVGTTSLVLNETETENHWVAFELVGTSSERDAVGTKVTVVAGGEVWDHWVTAGDGFLSKNESLLHFGLAERSAIDRVIVRWASGTEQTFDTVSVDQAWLLIEGQAEAFGF